jgi:predicted nucleic acid-binding protein
MGPVVLDPSVLIGLYDAKDAHHARASAANLDGRLAGARVILPTSVLSEIMVGTYRRFHDARGRPGRRPGAARCAALPGSAGR